MSSYIDLPGVVIRPEKVPAELRPLLKFGKGWAMHTDSLTEKNLARRPTAEIAEFVQACEAHLSMFEEFSIDGPMQNPMPDEVVLLQILHRNYLEARSELDLRRAKGK